MLKREKGEPVFTPPYTVVGGMERAAASGLSAFILNRGARYPRRRTFNELIKAGFDYIVSVETGASHYEINELSAAFPSVRFIILSDQVSIGQRINICVEELKSPLFFVLWNDLKLLYNCNAAKIAERLLLPANEIGRGVSGKNWYRRLCTAPVFQTTQFEQLPSAIAPILKKHAVETASFAAAKEDAPTLYPFQAVGVYDRQRFITIGGFDPLITNSYWQMLDFGLRAWLWGEEIRCTHHIHLCSDEIPALDEAVVDGGFYRFFLKNLLPVLRNAGTKDMYAHIPLKMLLRCLLQCNIPFEKSPFKHKLALFFEARQWVREHRENWKQSAETLIRNWEVHT
ncbi:MAG: hypothetical protein LBC77_06805 [Spirochaetaceae bacterium]|jgi:hypothetical protein|nr:hypothetical protein [Spirochaetaceae bacterium]